MLGIFFVGSFLILSIFFSIIFSLVVIFFSLVGISSVFGMNVNVLFFYFISDMVELVIEFVLDDLDLNEFGVVVLEKIFDNSIVFYLGSIIIGGSLL